METEIRFWSHVVLWNLSGTRQRFEDLMEIDFSSENDDRVFSMRLNENGSGN